MKIIENYDDMKRFEYVECGDVFEYENILYMKITVPGTCNNAVELTDGEALFFHESKLVRPVDCELRIK